MGILYIFGDVLGEQQDEDSSKFLKELVFTWTQRNSW